MDDPVDNILTTVPQQNSINANINANSFKTVASPATNQDLLDLLGLDMTSDAPADVTPVTDLNSLNDNITTPTTTSTFGGLDNLLNSNPMPVNDIFSDISAINNNEVNSKTNEGTV